MKVLWLAGESFWPADSGLYSYSQAAAASLSGAGADLAYVGRERGTGATGEWRLLEPLSRRRLAINLLRAQPVKIAAVSGGDYNTAVKDELAGHRPDVVVVDHLRAAGALNAVGSVPIVYCSQNNELQVRRSSSDEAPVLRRLAYKLDERWIRSWEGDLCQRASLITTISSDDAALFQKLYGTPPEKHHHLPPPYNGPLLSRPNLTSSTPRQICIVSDLRWELKKRNIAELLDVLVDPLHEAGIQLVLAGNGTQELSKQFPTVDARGFVEDLPGLLADCRLGLVYEPRGGGMKMKLLDYAFSGVPIVATATDLAGLPESATATTASANNPQEVVRSCLALIDDLDELNRMQHETYALCEKEFALLEIGERFKRAISEVL